MFLPFLTLIWPVGMLAAVILAMALLIRMAGSLDRIARSLDRIERQEFVDELEERLVKRLGASGTGGDSETP